MVDQKILEQNIISVLGIESLPDDKKVELIDKMAELTERRISLRLVNELNEDEVQTFFEETDDEVKIKLLNEKFPNIEEVIKEEVVSVKQEIISDIDNDEVLKTLTQP